MNRAILALVLGLSLAGCWMSDGPLFGEGDWAHLDLNGAYRVEMLGDNDGDREVTLSTRPDGLIEGAPDNPEDPEEVEEDSPLGLVRIAGGSGRFFVADDRPGRDGEHTYYVVHWTAEDSLAFYAPSCGGTPWIEGIWVDEEAKGGPTCMFSSKEALMRSALEAEHFLSRPHIVRVFPLYALNRVEEEATEEVGED